VAIHAEQEAAKINLRKLILIKGN